MKSKDKDIYEPANHIVAQCFSLDNPCLIDIALERNVLDNYLELLCSPNTTLITEALWGLSNITASTQAHILAFFAHERLLDYTLTLMSHSHDGIQKEALWVICNAVNSN